MNDEMSYETNDGTSDGANTPTSDQTMPLRAVGRPDETMQLRAVDGLSAAPRQQAPGRQVPGRQAPGAHQVPGGPGVAGVAGGQQMAYGLGSPGPGIPGPGIPGAPGQVAYAVPASADAPAPAPAPARARRLLARVLPTALVLALVAGGAVYIGITVNGAPDTAQTVQWGKSAKDSSDPAGDTSQGRHDTALTKMLLPVTGGWALGPDIGQYSNDEELSGKEAEAALKSAAVGLSGKNRRDYENRIEKMGAQGLALRSYSSPGSALIAEIRLTRLKDKTAIRDAYANTVQLFQSLGVFGKGPTIEGFSHATCFMEPSVGDSKLGGMYCTAYQDNLLITGDFYGGKPFKKSTAAELFQKQLKHLSSPGDYI